MLSLSNIEQIETLFAEMEPADTTDETLTPSLHAEDITVDDTPVEVEDEVTSIDESALGEFTPFSSSEVPVSLVAVDAGVLDLGITRTGFALAFKAAVVSQDPDGTHTVSKIGPKSKLITPDNRADLLRFVGRGLMNEEMSCIRKSRSRVLLSGSQGMLEG